MLFNFYIHWPGVLPLAIDLRKSRFWEFLWCLNFCGCPESDTFPFLGIPRWLGAGQLSPGIAEQEHRGCLHFMYWGVQVPRWCSQLSSARAPNPEGLTYRHRCLFICQRGWFKSPVWMVSDQLGALERTFLASYGSVIGWCLSFASLVPAHFPRLLINYVSLLTPDFHLIHFLLK